jgi:hypothetical protein
MVEHGFAVKRRSDGSIDFTAYRSEAARERSATRQEIFWEIVFPFCWCAPSRLGNLLAQVRTCARLSTGHQTSA